MNVMNLHVFSSGSRYRSAARCYGLEIWQDGDKVRDFRPVRLRNGLVVLWDFVNEKPYLQQVVSSPGSCVQFPAVGPDGEKVVSAFTLIVR